MDEFVLTRSQIMKLAKIAEHFTDTKYYTLYETHEGDIGPSMYVRFDLFEENDTQMKITDMSTW